MGILDRFQPKKKGDATHSFRIGGLDISLDLPSFVGPNPREEEDALVFATDEKDGEFEILPHRSLVASPDVAVDTWCRSESLFFRVQIPRNTFKSFPTKLGTAHCIVVEAPREGGGAFAIYHVFIPHCVGNTGIKIGYRGDYDKFKKSRRDEIDKSIRSLEAKQA